MRERERAIFVSWKVFTIFSNSVNSFLFFNNVTLQFFCQRYANILFPLHRSVQYKAQFTVAWVRRFHLYKQNSCSLKRFVSSPTFGSSRRFLWQTTSWLAGSSRWEAELSIWRYVIHKFSSLFFLVKLNHATNADTWKWWTQNWFVETYIHGDLYYKLSTTVGYNLATLRSGCWILNCSVIDRLFDSKK